MQNPMFWVIFACAIGLLMTWSVGANDLANVMSTTMGSKALRVRQAMIIAVVFEFAGAFFGGSHVTNTLRSGLINSQLFDQTPSLVVFGMVAILLSGTTWMLFASYWGMPVSITNAIVGGLVGFASVVYGLHQVHWQQVGMIAASWVCSPAIAGVVAYTLFRSIQRLILGSPAPAFYVHRYLGLYLFLIGLVLSNMVVIKGLLHFNVILGPISNFLLSLASSLAIVLVGLKVSKRQTLSASAPQREQFNYVEKRFSFLMALTACAMVFAHGSNDIAIAVGPIAAVFTAVLHPGAHEAATPAWIVFLACSGVVLGLLMYGRKVIETVGSGITALTPSRAFAATLAAATTVVISTGTGIPVSATQTLVGAVLGVGLARGIGALNLSVIRNIFMSWILTLPAASLLAIAYYYLLDYLSHWI